MLKKSGSGVTVSNTVTMAIPNWDYDYGNISMKSSRSFGPNEAVF